MKGQSRRAVDGLGSLPTSQLADRQRSACAVSLASRVMVVDQQPHNIGPTRARQYYMDVYGVAVGLFRPV